MPSVASHIAATISAHIDHVFGIMGNGNAWLLDALHRTNAEFTAVRHEAGAVIAADAYHRSSGRLAAATATYGAGYTNMLTPLAEAVQARIPMILVVGDEPTTGLRPWGVDQTALAATLGVRTYSVGQTGVAETTVTAIEHALANRVPTILAIPYDLATVDAGPLQAVRELQQQPALAPRGDSARAAIAEIAADLARARRPLLLAGRGAWLADAGQALGNLAAATGAVTATTALGRGVFPDRRYDVGVTGGFGAEGAMGLIRDADVAVIFGASLNQFTMKFGELFAPGTAVVQIDVGPTATHPRVGRYLPGDARLVAQTLLDELRTMNTDSSRWRESIDFPALRVRDDGDEIAPDGRLDPRSAAVAIGRYLPEDRVVVSDGGHFIGWANMYWPVSAPDRMVMVGTAYQSIGFGFGSVAGAARANPVATIVLTTGDGGGLMALADLETAVRTARGRGLAVVWNDAAYGAEVNLYGLQGLNQAPMRIDEVDFAALASAVGAEGVVVRRLEDLDRLAQWVAIPVEDRRFLLLDLRISGDVIAPYQEEIIRMNS